MKLSRVLPSLIIAVSLGLLVGVVYGAGSAHADTNNVYGGSQSDCGGNDTLVISNRSAAIFQGADRACVHLNSDSSTYVATAAPAGNTPCPQKAIDSGGPIGGLATTIGGQAKCIYFHLDPIFAPLSVSTTNSSTAATQCPATATPGLNINCVNKNPIYALLQFIINWAVRLLGALAVLAVVISGIQYIVSQGNPDGIKKAKSRLTNAVVGLILLSLAFVILHFLGVV